MLWQNVTVMLTHAKLDVGLILTITADKVTFRKLEKRIPCLTRNRFSAARKHTVLHERGAPLPFSQQTRLFVSPVQIDHFVDFITRHHIIQDLLFGENSIKLCTNEVMTVPNFCLLTVAAILLFYSIFLYICS